jgi:hypothetical protein
MYNRSPPKRLYTTDAAATPELHEKYPGDQPVTTLDARDLQSLFQAAYEWLAHNYELVNRLNVFPVPDGDTGTNMLLTIKSALANIKGQPHATVGDVAEAAAEGAHHGSRGNSGVILGQILQGFSQGLREKARSTPAIWRTRCAPPRSQPTPRCRRRSKARSSPSRVRSAWPPKSPRSGRVTCASFWRTSSPPRTTPYTARPSCCPCSSRPASSIRAARVCSLSSKGCIAPSPASQ